MIEIRQTDTILKHQALYFIKYSYVLFEKTTLL